MPTKLSLLQSFLPHSWLLIQRIWCKMNQLEYNQYNSQRVTTRREKIKKIATSRSSGINSLFDHTHSKGEIEIAENDFVFSEFFRSLSKVYWLKSRQFIDLHRLDRSAIFLGNIKRLFQRRNFNCSFGGLPKVCLLNVLFSTLPSLNQGFLFLSRVYFCLCSVVAELFILRWPQAMTEPEKHSTWTKHL